MVRSNLEYCSSIWAPHTKQHIDKIESVQRRAARYVAKRYHNTPDKVIPKYFAVFTDWIEYVTFECIIECMRLV
jgi:hypothetical protein